MDIKKISINELLPLEENPNEMKDKKFNSLVKTIEEIGYDQPIKVFWNEEKKKYEIIKGNHRFWAMKLLGEKEIDCVIGNYENRDEALRDCVRDNIVKGQLDPFKFTKIIDSLSDKYGDEAVKEMFSFIDEAEMKKLYKEVKESLPEDLKKKLDEAKDDIKTIDDLSIVLNKIFAEHGDMLKFNFMVFDYMSGGKICYIRASKENWKTIEEMVQYCKDNKKDINEIIQISIKK